jgi:hypothetical protein
MKEPCGIQMNDVYLYVFETLVQDFIPNVHQYAIENDVWKVLNIRDKNKDIRIVPTFNCSVYQISFKEILILGGTQTSGQYNASEKGFYYKYNTDTEEFSEPVDDESRDTWRPERQGNLDFSDKNIVYTRLGDAVVKQFHELTEDKIVEEGNWCSSSRK